MRAGPDDRVLAVLVIDDEKNIRSTLAACLDAYPWPGNVRELRNAIERAVILSPAGTIEVGNLPDPVVAHASGAPCIGGRFTIDQIEREHIEQVLARAATQEQAARILGIDFSTLWRRRRKYGLG